MPACGIRVGFLACIAATAVVALSFVGPIPQDPNYHLFADARRIFWVPNFWNVISNVPFIVAGAFGLTRLSRLSHAQSSESYLVLCIGVLLTGLGSAYYHEAPSNATLLWDRLPMTVAFMALLSLLLGERVARRHRRGSLWALVSIGVGSTLYWAWTESSGHGDLRLYLLVQFLPVVLLPLILLMFRQKYLSNALLLSAFGLYVAAKALEHFDGQVFAALGYMSGHAIKHVVAAAAVLCIICAVPMRRGSSRSIDTRRIHGMRSFEAAGWQVRDTERSGSGVQRR